MPTTRPEQQYNPYPTGTVQSIRERRNARKSPQPWFILKLTIAIAAAIIAYATYVYIGRLCIPMIKHRSGSSLGSRTLGSEYHWFIIFFCPVHPPPFSI
jgi:palmitoyltransferase